MEVLRKIFLAVKKAVNALVQNVNYKKIFKRYNEFLSIPIAVFLYLTAPVFIRMFDDTAGHFDPGYLHSIFFALVAVNVASGVAWFMFWLKHPVLYRYFDDKMEDELLNGEVPAKLIKMRAMSAHTIFLQYYIGILVMIAIVL